MFRNKPSSELCSTGEDPLNIRASRESPCFHVSTTTGECSGPRPEVRGETRQKPCGRMKKLEYRKERLQNETERDKQQPGGSIPTESTSARG